MFFWLLVGIVIGLFIPAPYDHIAKTAFSRVWKYVVSLFKEGDT